MARMHHWLGLAALTLALTGCVSQEKYNALKLERDRFAEQLGQAQTEASAARSEADAYKNQIAAIMQGGTGKEALILNLTNENAELKKQIDDLNRQYADAVGKIGTGNALPEPLTNELQAFANANPDLVDFDAADRVAEQRAACVVPSPHCARDQRQLLPRHPRGGRADPRVPRRAGSSGLGVRESTHDLTLTSPSSDAHGTASRFEGDTARPTAHDVCVPPGFGQGRGDSAVPVARSGRSGPMDRPPVATNGRHRSIGGTRRCTDSADARPSRSRPGS